MLRLCTCRSAAQRLLCRRNRTERWTTFCLECAAGRAFCPFEPVTLCQLDVAEPGVLVAVTAGPGRPIGAAVLLNAPHVLFHAIFSARRTACCCRPRKCRFHRSAAVPPVAMPVATVSHPLRGGTTSPSLWRRSEGELLVTARCISAAQTPASATPLLPLPLLLPLRIVHLLACLPPPPSSPHGFAVRKILIANNGIAAVKAIRSIRRWAYDTFGNEREVCLCAFCARASASPPPRRPPATRLPRRALARRSPSP